MTSDQHQPLNNGLKDQQDYCLQENRFCGFGRWRPKSLRRFSGIKTFTMLLSGITMLNHCLIFYYNGIVTTIEKTYGLSSSTTGLLKNVNNISYLFSAILVSHFFRYSNKPRLLSFSCLLASVAAFMFAFPHFLYGKGLMADHQRVDPEDLTDEIEVHVCQSNSTTPRCSLDRSDEGFGSGIGVTGGFIWMVLGQILRGISHSPVFALGIVHMDDEAKKNSPMFFGFLFLLTSFGQLGGMFLSGLANSLYIDLSNPDMNSSDPNWVGAWWLGYIIAAVLYLVVALPVLMLPAQTVKQPTQQEKEEAKQKMMKDQGGKGQLSELRNLQNQGLSEVLASVKDLPAAFYRLFTNILFVLIISGITLEMYKIGYMTFLPKYIEIYFHYEPVKASIMAGLAATIPFMVGPILGGVLMAKFKISLQRLFHFMIIVIIIHMCGYVVLMLIKCQQNPWAQNEEGSSDQRKDLFNLPCNQHCHCDPAVLDPVCGSNGINYWSPCVAGCDQSMENNKTFSSCSCVLESFPDGNHNATPLNLPGSAVSGYCDQECVLVWLYLGVLIFIGCISTSFMIPMFIVLMRIVSHRDKALSMATGSTIVMGLSVPAPILFGLAIDWTCVSQRPVSCTEENGACAVYDLDSLRHVYHGIYLLIKVFTLIIFGIAACVCKMERYKDRDCENQIVEMETKEAEIKMLENKKVKV